MTKEMTAVQWLWQISRDREIDKFDWEKALEMEKQQMATNSSHLEISDEDIEMLNNFKEFMWYREQLKQKQTI